MTNIVLGAGETVTCTFTNTERQEPSGTIVVRKITDPSPDPSGTSFGFTAGGGLSPASFSLEDGDSREFDNLLPRAGYSLAESVATGWDLISASCDDGSPVSNIDLGAGETVTCTFHDRQQGRIVVTKETDPSGSAQSFASSTSYGSGFSLKDAQSNDSGPLTPGSGYSVSESPTPGWDLTSASCDDGSPVTNIVVGAGETVTCTFTNTQRGSIVVKKATDPTGSPDTFSFTSNFAGGFTLQDGGTKTTNGLVPGGGYSVAETPRSGYTLTSATCDHGTPSVVQVRPGQTTTCTFTNQIRGHVRIVKRINGAPLTSSSPTFTFELRQGDQHAASASPLETLMTNGTNLGTLSFTTGLVPGQTYAICEHLEASYNPTISGYGPYNPTDAPNYWCFNFSLTFAQAAGNPSLTFTVDNSHPQSKGLTIGFWKNWSACKNSKGKQTDVLGQYLNGITLGTITFTTNGTYWECQAIQTLSKNTFGGTNKASDPLFSMAAQLLAADLNVSDKAGVCSAAVTATNNAQALLVKYGWNGNTYGPPGYPALTSTDASLANQLAATLDKYNNNQLC